VAEMRDIPDIVNTEFSQFFEFSTEQRTAVTVVSAKLFAARVATLAVESAIAAQSIPCVDKQCVGGCNAAKSDNEIRRMESLLSRALPYVEASAEASHFTDGFNRKPSNSIDRLSDEIKTAITEAVNAIEKE